MGECAASVPEVSEVNLPVVSERMSGQGKKDRRLRVATWKEHCRIAAQVYIWPKVAGYSPLFIQECV